MKHLIFIVTMLVAGVGAGVWIMHVHEQMREAADAAADAAVVKPPDAAVVPIVEDVPPPPPPTQIDAAPSACDEIACALNDYPGECCAKFRPPPEAHADDCDEVSCVLDDYARPCCDHFRPHGSKRDAGVADGKPVGLDRAMIADGVNSVKPRIQACQVREVHVRVKVHVRVAPSGAVSSVTVDPLTDPALGKCVHDVMTSILFKPTQAGGSFTYPFVF
jgi:hypothetical protein